MPSDPSDLIDHIGWDLWRLAALWKADFAARMAVSGHHWFSDARGSLVPLIGRSGISQNDLTARASMTKQAVQQHLDALVADGIIDRIPDPDDARRKRIVFTKQGLSALDAIQTVKRQIEADYANVLGEEALSNVQAALRHLAETLESR